MTQQKSVKKPASKPRTRTPAAKSSETTTSVLAHKAASAGKAVGKTSLRIARPLVQSVKHEDNRTLAKMVVAAVTPKLINYGLRFALRHPVFTALGVLAIATAIGAQQGDDET
jgi:hypothetical protein